MTRKEQMSSDFPSESTINIQDILNPEWIVSRQSIQMDSVIVQRDFVPSGAIEHPPLKHHMIGFLLSPSVSGVSKIGQEKYEGLITKGNFFVNPLAYPGVHAGGNNIETITLIIKPDFLCQIAAESECVNPDNIELHPIPITYDQQMEYLANSFFYEIQNEALGGRIYSEALATQFAIHLLRNYCTFPARLKKYNGGLSSRKLQAAIDYIDAHLEENISLSNLAQITQINSSHYFCSLFKKSTGISPYKYVIQQRIARAKQLLKQNDLPLVEIALRCGFSSQSAFSRTFSKLVGITPQKYRKQV